MQPDATAPAMPAFRSVASGQGRQWWSSAWQLLFHGGATWTWIAMGVISLIIMMVLSAVPILGDYMNEIALFVLTGGLMRSADKGAAGGKAMVGDLFSGFDASMSSLLLAAVLVLVGWAIVYWALALAGVGALFGAAYAAMTGNWALLLGLGIGSMLACVAILIVATPLMMAGWLAPALIVLKNQPPLEALKSSLAACWANVGALTVYGLLGIGFAVLATITVVGWLVLIPLIALSTYTAYRDLYAQAG